jgi:uncharacterized membrane protein YbhN (UPF0104 family)
MQQTLKVEGMQGKPGKMRWWPVVKSVLGLAILGCIVWVFAWELSQPELWERPLALGWLVPAALLYLAGLALWALYWRRLLVHLGHRPTVLATMRAYFVGQLGKFVPGKMLAVVLRAGLLRDTGTPGGLAGLTAFYEVLVSMSAGALLALLLFLATDLSAVLGSRGEALLVLFRPPWPNDLFLDRLTLVVLALGLCGLILVPIYPPVFNRLIHRVTLPFRSGPAPRLEVAWLVEGLAWATPCWLFLGLGLACALHAVPGAGLDWSPATLAYLTAVMALAYVAGFIIPSSSLGIREYLLRILLAGELAQRLFVEPLVARGMVVLAVILLRLAWTTAEVLLAVLLYRAAGGGPAAAIADDRLCHERLATDSQPSASVPPHGERHRGSDGGFSSALFRRRVSRPITGSPRIPS